MYCTVAMLRTALAPGQTDPAEEPSENTDTAADLTNDELTSAIAEADSFINGALAGRYVTPVADVAGKTLDPLPFWSRNIAGYLATITYRGSQDFTDNDPVYRRYAMTQKFLDMVANGDYTLPFPANTGPSAGGGAGDPINPNGGSLNIGAWESPGWPDVAYGQQAYMHPLLNPLEGSVDQFEALKRGYESG